LGSAVIESASARVDWLCLAVIIFVGTDMLEHKCFDKQCKQTRVLD